MRLYHIIILFIFSKLVLASENNLPKIISDKTVRQQHYLPDFSFASTKLRLMTAKMIAKP